jgi:hypothetical protein
MKVFIIILVLSYVLFGCKEKSPSPISVSSSEIPTWTTTSLSCYEVTDVGYYNGHEFYDTLRNYKCGGSTGAFMGKINFINNDSSTFSIDFSSLPDTFATATSIDVTMPYNLSPGTYLLGSSSGINITLSNTLQGSGTPIPGQNIILKGGSNTSIEFHNLTVSGYIITGHSSCQLTYLISGTLPYTK